MKKITQFQNLVYGATKKIPKGKVSTYGEIARIIGKPRAARAVGNALNCNPFAPASTRGDRLPASTRLSNRGESTRGGPQIPCHRVVRSDGSVGGFAGGSKKKIVILEQEKVKIKKGKVADFAKRLFIFR